AAAYKSDLAIAKAHENSIEKTLAATVAESQTTNKAQIELHQLQTAAQSYRALYDNFQQRYTDSVQEQLFPVTQARIITRRSRPIASSPLKSLKLLTIGALGGVVLGLGVVFLRHFSDGVVRTGMQGEAHLNTECWPMFPPIKKGPTASKIAANAGWFQ